MLSAVCWPFIPYPIKINTKIKTNTNFTNITNNNDFLLQQVHKDLRALLDPVVKLDLLDHQDSLAVQVSLDHVVRMEHLDPVDPRYV